MASCGKVERLIQAHLDNELSTAERAVVGHHLSECAECERKLALHKGTSATLFEAFTEVRLREPLREKVMAHLPEMEHHHEVHPSWQPQYKKVRFQLLRTLAPALAPILVLLLGVILFYAWPASDFATGELLGMVTHRQGQVSKHRSDEVVLQRVSLRSEVTAGEHYETDSDSSLILVLNGPTELKTDANTRFQVEGDRKILLEAGRIWLNVAKSPQPFRVETPSGRVTVFGTTFDVRVDDVETTAEPAMTVTVASGEVKVESGVGFTPLLPGQQVNVVRGQIKLTPKKVDVGLVMAWADRLQSTTVVDQRFVTVARIAATEADTWSPATCVVPTNGLQVRSVVLSWLPDMYRSGHSGYMVYVYDLSKNALFSDYIAGRVFDSDDDNSFVMMAPNGLPLDNVSTLVIELIPDRSGMHATTFKDPLVSN